MVVWRFILIQKTFDYFGFPSSEASFSFAFSNSTALDGSSVLAAAGAGPFA